MSRPIILSACIVALFFSCKKNNAPPSGPAVITANISGTTETFNTTAQASLASAGGEYALSITGFNGTTGSSDEMAISVAGANPIKAGSYTLTTNEVYDQGDLAYVQAGGNKYSGGGNNPVVNVIITFLTSTNVKGTFSGTIPLYSGSGAASLIIANGTFDVPIK